VRTSDLMRLLPWVETLRTLKNQSSQKTPLQFRGRGVVLRHVAPIPIFW
jgi:hypothetical protein